MESIILLYTSVGDLCHYLLMW